LVFARRKEVFKRPVSHEQDETNKRDRQAPVRTILHNEQGDSRDSERPTYQTTDFSTWPFQN
jgi:hypothetical protein